MFNEPEAYVRPPAVAGARSFYPADAQELKSMIDDCLMKADVDNGAKPFGIISPHAGYVFSGPVAAYAYKTLAGHSYDSVIVISPSHYDGFGFVSALPKGGYRTPLGTIPVDERLVEELIGKSEGVVAPALRGHKDKGWGSTEHALEVQLPFLQSTLESFKLVPLIMGIGGWEICRNLGDALAEVVKDKNVLIVASSDLSHFHPYDEAKRMDLEFIEIVKNGEIERIANDTQIRDLEACGGAPIASMMHAAQTLGCQNPQVLNYANSGDIPGTPKEQVVGYMAAVIYRQE